MTKMMSESALRRRQAAAKARWDDIPKSGPHCASWYECELERAQNRMRAHVLLEYGWSMARVAAETRISVKSLEKWDAAGRPLGGDSICEGGGNPL